MAACAVKRGIIALRDCGQEGINTCSECGRPACGEHTRIASGDLLCVECYARREQAASAAAKGSGGSSKGPKAATPKGEAPAEEWNDPTYPYTYRHHYYSSYHYSPIYMGDYYDSYYDDYDVRSFDSTDQGGLDGDGPDAGGFYDS
jgi:hypothetical protein